MFLLLVSNMLSLAVLHLPLPSLPVATSFLLILNCMKVTSRVVSRSCTCMMYAVCWCNTCTCVLFSMFCILCHSPSFHCLTVTSPRSLCGKKNIAMSSVALVDQFLWRNNLIFACCSTMPSHSESRTLTQVVLDNR